MKLLLAEDEPVSRRALESLLGGWGYSVISCGDGAEAWKILQAEDAPKLAILDWMMPGFDGPTLCRMVRNRPERAYVYIILLTVRDQKQDLLEGMEAGADEYISKPFDAEELRARLRTARRLIELQEELVRAREALREQATRDALTGLWNRPAILDILQRELVRASREKRTLGLILADLDNFKRINDAYGHRVGDAVLKETSRRIVSVLRPYDAAGRYGGDEFLVVLPGCDEAETAATAERIRVRVGLDQHETTRGPVPVTICLGAAIQGLEETRAVEDLIHTADEALYRAKANGRNRIEVYR